MALDGIGKRDVVAEGNSDTTGPFLVEEVKVDGGKVVRRLYFRNNENVVQTEVFWDVDQKDVDRWNLAFDYHKHISVGILVLGGRLTTTAW